MIKDNSLTFPNFKKIILEGVNQRLKEENFTFKKGSFSFLKMRDKNKIELSFDFLNYFPQSLEYNFLITIAVKELEELLLDFYTHAKIEGMVTWNGVILEGDFIDILKEKEFKFRSNYYNEITSLEQLKIALERTVDLLKSTALPLAVSLASLSFFQEYYLKRKEKLILNLGSESVILSALAAAWLKSNDELRNLYDYLKAELSIQKTTNVVNSHLESLIESFHKFLSARGRK